MKLFQVRLDNVWGVGGGIRPVKYLVRAFGIISILKSLIFVLHVLHNSIQVKKIILLLKEYLCSQDVAEASRCLLDLEVFSRILNIDEASLGIIIQYMLVDTLCSGSSLPP